MVEPAGHRRPKGMNHQDRIRQIKDETANTDGGSEWIDARNWSDAKNTPKIHVAAEAANSQ